MSCACWLYFARNSVQANEGFLLFYEYFDKGLRMTYAVDVSLEVVVKMSIPSRTLSNF